MKTLLLAALFLPMFLAGQARTGVITGRILGTAGQPASGVRVSAMPEPRTDSALTGAAMMVSIVETDDSGRYRLDNVPPGRYVVAAGTLDAPTFYPGASTVEQARVVTLTGTSPVTGIDFQMTAASFGVTVSGRVTQLPGRGIANLPVIITGTGSYVHQTIVNADGSFKLERVFPDSYQLYVSDTRIRIPVIVVDRDITGIEVLVLPEVTLYGSIVVEGDGLQPQMTVSFVPYQGGLESVSTNTTVDSGRYFLARLREGEYRVSWDRLPAGYTLKSIRHGSVDLLTAPLKAFGAASAESIVITLGVESPPPWVKVSGRVHDQHNRPPSEDSALMIMPVPSRVPSPGGGPTLASQIDHLGAIVNPDGTFEFPMVPAGVYTARVFTVRVPSALPIVVGKSDMTGVDVLIPARKDVAGHVIVEGQSTTTTSLSAQGRGAVLLFELTRSSENGHFTAEAQPDGNFKVRFPEGESHLALKAPGYEVKSLTYGSTDLLQDTLQVNADDQRELQVTLTVAP